MSPVDCVAKEFGLTSCEQEVNIVNGWSLCQEITLKVVNLAIRDKSRNTAGRSEAFTLVLEVCPAGWAVERPMIQFRCAGCHGPVWPKDGERAGSLATDHLMTPLPLLDLLSPPRSLSPDIQWFRKMQQTCFMQHEVRLSHPKLAKGAGTFLQLTYQKMLSVK